MPNLDGDYTVGFFLKLTGTKSVEYFKDRPEEFEKFVHELYPDFKWLIPNIREIFGKFSFSRMASMKCYTWSYNNFLLIGDAAHT